MSEFSVSLAKLAEEANLTVAYTPCELEKVMVTATEVYRPGILLAGYYENFDNKRVQIIGLTEMSYLEELSTSLRNTHLEKLFSFQPPAVILTRGMQPLSEMMQFAKQYGVPLLMSTEMTSALMGMLITTLNKELAPRITRHGVLVEVYGEGILTVGRERRRQKRDRHRAGQARPPSDRRRCGGAAPRLRQADPAVPRRKTSAILLNCAASASSTWRRVFGMRLGASSSVEGRDGHPAGALGHAPKTTTALGLEHRVHRHPGH